MLDPPAAVLPKYTVATGATATACGQSPSPSCEVYVGPVVGLRTALCLRQPVPPQSESGEGSETLASSVGLCVYVYVLPPCCAGAGGMLHPDSPVPLL